MELKSECASTQFYITKIIAKVKLHAIMSSRHEECRFKIQKASAERTFLWGHEGNDRRKQTIGSRAMQPFSSQKEADISFQKEKGREGRGGGGEEDEGTKE